MMLSIFIFSRKIPLTMGSTSEFYNQNTDVIRRKRGMSLLTLTGTLPWAKPSHALKVKAYINDTWFGRGVDLPPKTNNVDPNYLCSTLYAIDQLCSKNKIYINHDKEAIKQYVEKKKKASLVGWTSEKAVDAVVEAVNEAVEIGGVTIKLEAMDPTPELMKICPFVVTFPGSEWTSHKK